MNQVTIRNKFLSLTVLDYGAIIQKLEVLHPDGKKSNVVVGLESPEAYLQDAFFLGACVGRFAGRIDADGFSLDETHYPLYSENGCHLHGGKTSFGKRFWTIEKVEEGEQPAIRLSYLSKDMEEGYPGNLLCKVVYSLKGTALHITHSATTDKNTIVNLTNHSYFKLDDTNNVQDYMLQLNCPSRLETHANLLPTGTILSNTESPYDFRQERKIGLVALDTPFVIDPSANHAACLSSAISGIQMKVVTNQPAIVVFTPSSFAGICFEAQNFPDAPNHANFPSSLLKVGETYNNTAVFKFGFVH